ncbi:MAG: hypothetical protein ABI188_06870 [Collimonas sp.]|uniref:hypothetical protein n=1 Tax=Collimonas sp. TaxID=1963772 RepID=UPI0032661B69
MIGKISDDDALILAKELRSFDLNETTSVARFVESLIFDPIFCEEWERICSMPPELQFYGTLADAILNALANQENWFQERANQLLVQIEAHYESLCTSAVSSEPCNDRMNWTTRESMFFLMKTEHLPTSKSI